MSLNLIVPSLILKLLGVVLGYAGYKCYHPPFRKRFVYRDVIFFVSIPFFFPLGTSLHEETFGEDSSVLLSISVPFYYFDDISRNKSELKVYIRRKKSSKDQNGDNFFLGFSRPHLKAFLGSKSRPR